MLVRFFDIEANGLQNEVTKIHCGVFKDKDSGEIFKFRSHQMEDMIKFMASCDVLIGHNIIDYDLPVINKILKFEFKGKKVDSLLMSRLLNPKRVLPPHAKDRSAAPHGLGCSCRD
jgi:DNA polymerase I